jgi:predicted transcriptional regulator of viral defense system
MLAEMSRRRQDRLSVVEARHLVGTPALKVVSSMARKGLLDRVRRGVYVVRPLRAIARPWSLTALVAVEQAMAGEPHYIGGLAAFTLHRLTEQTHATVIDVYLAAHRRTATIANARVRFHKIAKADLLLGLQTVAIEQVPVSVSDPERTLLDALDRPAAVGGLLHGVPLVLRALDRVDTALLASYACTQSSTSTIQRLGVLLERRGAAEGILAALSDRVRDTVNKPAMLPGSRRGRLHPRWRIIENDL